MQYTHHSHTVDRLGCKCTCHWYSILRSARSLLHTHHRRRIAVYTAKGFSFKAALSCSMLSHYWYVCTINDTIIIILYYNNNKHNPKLPHTKTFTHTHTRIYIHTHTNTHTHTLHTLSVRHHTPFRLVLYTTKIRHEALKYCCQFSYTRSHFLSALSFSLSMLSHPHVSTCSL